MTVVVDFRGLGGGVQQGCAPGSPASGVAALNAAGFGHTYASRQPGFVCRINGKPGNDADKCVNTSPSSAYWSYWHAPTGGAWSYSNQGAATYAPARGSVEGWAFGAGEQPGIAPPAAPAPPPPPAPPQPQVPAPNPVNPPAAPPQTTTTTTGPSSSVPTTSAPSSVSETASSTTSAGATTTTVVKPTGLQEKPSSGWLWTVLGVLLIVVLVVVGLVVARRRRAEAE